MGEKEQRSETGNRGRETRNNDLRQGTEDGRQGTDTRDRRHRTLDKGQEKGTWGKNMVQYQ
jgi:hypothetical protein